MEGSQESLAAPTVAHKKQHAPTIRSHGPSRIVSDQPCVPGGWYACVSVTFPTHAIHVTRRRILCQCNF